MPRRMACCKTSALGALHSSITVMLGKRSVSVSRWDSSSSPAHSASTISTSGGDCWIRVNTLSTPAVSAVTGIWLSHFASNLHNSCKLFSLRLMTVVFIAFRSRSRGFSARMCFSLQESQCFGGHDDRRSWQGDNIAKKRHKRRQKIEIHQRTLTQPRVCTITQHRPHKAYAVGVISQAVVEIFITTTGKS